MAGRELRFRAYATPVEIPTVLEEATLLAAGLGVLFNITPNPPAKPVALHNPPFRSHSRLRHPQKPSSRPASVKN